MARPSIPESEKRNKKVQVNLNEEENRALENLATVTGLDKASLLRLAWNEYRKQN